MKCRPMRSYLTFGIQSMRLLVHFVKTYVFPNIYMYVYIGKCKHITNLFDNACITSFSLERVGPTLRVLNKKGVFL